MAAGDFRRELELFCGWFDGLEARDRFRGEELDARARLMVAKHGQLAAQTAFAAPGEQLRLRPQPGPEPAELLAEDERILAGSWPQPQPDDPLAATQAALAELYWRAAQARHLHYTLRALRNAGRHDDDRRESVWLARYALRFAPNHHKCCHWLMIVLGWQLDACPAGRERLLLSRVFLASISRRLEQTPGEYLAHHLLARYYIGVAELSWLERTFASSVLGAKLRGSFEEAERELRLAHQLNPWLPNGLWMARVLLARKRPAREALEWLEVGLQLGAEEPTSELEQIQMLELRARLDPSAASPAQVGGAPTDGSGAQVC